jgi:hypothetical protein
MDFGICGKSFRFDIVVYYRDGNFIHLLHFLGWQLVTNVCKYSLNRIGDKRQPIGGPRQWLNRLTGVIK